MTEAEVIAAVQAQANDFTAPFEDRIRASIPLAVAMFAAEYQWEFLDVYTTTTTALDATTGKYKITAPTDFFKPVALATDLGGPIEYQNRIDWIEAQRGSSGTETPQRYTVIGTTMFLQTAPDSSTIWIVYTKNSDNITLGDIPGQYHPAIVQGIVLWLMPGVITDAAGNSVANPLYDAADVRYRMAVSKAAQLEAQNKGRPRTLDFPPLMKLRSQYDR